MDRIRNHIVRCNLQGLGIGSGHNYLNSRSMCPVLIAKLFAHGPAKGELKMLRQWATPKWVIC